MKDAVLPIRLTGEQRERLQNAAAEAGNTISGYVRHAALVRAEQDRHRAKRLREAEAFLRANGIEVPR